MPVVLCCRPLADSTVVGPAPQVPVSAEVHAREAVWQQVFRGLTP